MASYFGYTVPKTLIMSQQNNFVNPEYNEGTPDSSGNIINMYTVEEKDTLADIAAKYGVSIEDILAANKDQFSDPDAIVHPGAKIMIPKL